MQKRYCIWLPALLICLLAFNSCDGSADGPTPEEMIAKSWRLQKLSMKDGNAPPPQIMGTASFNFNKNGRYEILMGPLERGEWRLSEDDKVLITTDDVSKVEKHIDIEKIEPEMLVLYNDAGATPLRMELVPDL